MDRRIGSLLIQMELIDRATLDEALRRQQHCGRLIGQILIDMQAVGEEDIAQALSVQLGIPRFDKSSQPQPLTVGLFPAHLAELRRCIPVRLENGSLFVAMADPLDIDALDDLSFLTGCEIKPLVATETEVLTMLERFCAGHDDSSGVGELLAEINAGVDAAQPVQTISIMSNKGGVGKTHVALSLAACLARSGKRTLLVDADLGTADCSNKLRLYPDKTILDFFNRTLELGEVICPTRFGFDLIAGRGGNLRLANLKHLQKLRFIRNFTAVAESYDYALFDLGGGIGMQTLDFALSAGRTFIVTTPRDVVSGYACLKAAFERFCHLESRLRRTGNVSGAMAGIFAPGIIVNQVQYYNQGQAVFGKIAEAAAHHLRSDDPLCRVQPYFAGAVLHDGDSAAIAEQAGAPIAAAQPGSDMARCIEQISVQISDVSGDHPPHPTPLNNLRRLAEIIKLRPFQCMMPDDLAALV